jgi:two-component system, sensor histidine kinase and response regulator
MDCMMPYMDGFEAARAIRQLETEGQHIPIIALSAGITAIERENCFKAGMDAFLAKPVKSQELAVVLASLLDPVEIKL